MNNDKHFCTQCGAELGADARFCSHCGHKIETAPARPVCPGCGKPREDGAKFCPFCGQGFAAEKKEETVYAPPPEAKSEARTEVKTEVKTEIKTEGKTEKKTEKEYGNTASEPQTRQYSYSAKSAQAAAAQKPKTAPAALSPQNTAKTISTVLTILLAVALAVAIPVTVLRRLTDPAGLERIADRAAAVLDADDLTVTTEKGERTIIYIVRYALNGIEGFNRISEESIEAEFKDELLSDFIYTFFRQYLDAEGSDEYSPLSNNELYYFIAAQDGRLASLVRGTGYVGTVSVSKNRAYVTRNLQELLGDDGITAAELLGSSEGEDGAQLLSSIAPLVSESASLLTTSFAITLAVILLIVNLTRLGEILRKGGTIALCTGAVWFLIALLSGSVSGLLGLEGGMADAAGFVIEYGSALLKDTSLTVAVIGAAAVGIGLIMKKKGKNKA